MKVTWLFTPDCWCIGTGVCFGQKQVAAWFLCFGVTITWGPVDPMWYRG